MVTKRKGYNGREAEPTKDSMIHALDIAIRYLDFTDDGDEHGPALRALRAQLVAPLGGSPASPEARDAGVAPCNVCLGVPLESGRPCICGGIGTERAELQGFRERCYDLEQQLAARASREPEPVDEKPRTIFRDESTEEGKRVWAAVEKAAQNAPEWAKKRAESVSLEHIVNIDLPCALTEALSHEKDPAVIERFVRANNALPEISEIVVRASREPVEAQRPEPERVDG